MNQVLPPEPASSWSNVFHPTDFSPTSELAFAHALKLAYLGRSSLNILHVSPHRADHDWGGYPQVRRTLERWGDIRSGASQADVAAAGLRVRKSATFGRNPGERILSQLERTPADLIVLATYPRKGAGAWLRPAIALPISRSAGVTTLFVPEDTLGFVSSDTGAVYLSRILIPVDHTPNAGPALEALVRLVDILQVSASSCCLLYVGEKEPPKLDPPAHARITWEWKVASGDPVSLIVDTAKELRSQLILMTTEGRRGLMDSLRGSTTERVLRDAPCPLMALSALRAT